MVIDIILLLILVCCVRSGYRKGLLMSMLGLVIVVASCLGAGLAQKAMTPTVVRWMEPQVANAIEDKLDTATRQAQENGIIIDGQTIDMGTLSAILSYLQIEVDTAQLETSGVTVIAQKMANQLLTKVAGVMIYFAAFLLLYLIFHSIILMLNVVDRLPVVHTLNHAGGAVIGLMKGLVAILVAVTVLNSDGLMPYAMGPVSELLITWAKIIL